MAGKHRAPRLPLHRRLAAWFRPASSAAVSSGHPSAPETAADLLDRLEAWA